MKLTDSKWPAIIWSAIVFMALAMPAQELEQEQVKIFPHADKLVHIVLFGVFTWLWMHIPAYRNGMSRRRILTLMAASMGYGIAMEFVQLLPLVGRDFSYGDMLADGVGSLAVILTCKKKPRWKPGSLNQN